jgi:protease-4
MKQFLITVAGVFAGLVLFFVGVPMLVLTIAAGAAKPAAPPARTVLSLDLRQSLSDQESQNPLAGFGSPSMSVLSVIQTLHHAERDERVRGLLIRLPEGGLSPAAADELRLAIKAFRASGKPVIAHSQGIYPSGATASTYMVGAAADQFWMQPAASLQAVGMAQEELFMKRLFDRYGVRADFERRAEYKNAVNPFLYDDYTPEHREATLSWMGSIHGSALAAAAADRRVAPAALKAALEAGPRDAEDARAAGLIDRVGHLAEAQAALIARAGEGARLVAFDDYEPDLDSGARGRPVVAVIKAEGAIVTGTSKNQSLGQGGAVFSDDVAKAFDDAAKDKDVRAIVFRVSSPGGSDTASEQIRAAMLAAKAAGKPVVVSMGTYAASGGYWISAGADRIVAQPSTLTGSIGVYGGKFVLGEALRRFGVDAREISVGGDYADAFGMDEPFTPAQRVAFSAWMDRIYANFIARVAEGRKLPPDRVKEIARGRVWTGEQARTLGLVDEIGGFYQAIAAAKRLARIEAGQDVRLKLLPARRSPFDLLQQALGVSATGVRALAAAGWVLGDPRAQNLLDRAAQARLGAQGSTVLAPTPLN